MPNVSYTQSLAAMLPKNPKDMNFEPFVGNIYEEQNFKILLLGESHHFGKDDMNDFQKEPLKYKDVTKNVLGNFFDYKNGNSKFYHWMNTFTKFTNIFNNRPVLREQNEEFWNKLLFYNYVQTPVDSARKSPTPAQFKNSHESFVKIIDELKPNLIIVWGYRLWRNMPKNECLTRKDEIDFYNNIPVLVIPHPASSKFDYSMNQFINKYIDTIKKHCSQHHRN